MPLKNVIIYIYSNNYGGQQIEKIKKNSRIIGGDAYVFRCFIGYATGII
jgi:hypothetical protein